MTTKIECWKDHHEGLPKIKNLHDLYKLIYHGFLFIEEDETHDEKVTITIETED